MEKILKTLMTLGLSEKEAKIYLALYKIGQGTSYEVAKEAGVKRPTVYVLMEELRKKGLALVIPHSKKQVYVAKDPHEFINEYQSNMNRSMSEFISLLPKLSRPSADIIAFKGDGALAQGLAFGIHGMRDKNVCAFYAGVRKKMKISPVYTEHYANLHKLGFRLRSVVPADSEDAELRKNDKAFGFETRRVSSSLLSPFVSMEIYGDQVKTIFHKKKEVLVISDKDLAEFYKRIFEMVWKS